MVIKDGIKLPLPSQSANIVPTASKGITFYYNSIQNLTHDQIRNNFDIEYVLGDLNYKTPTSGSYYVVNSSPKMYQVDVSNTPTNTYITVNTRPKGCPNTPWVESNRLNISSFNTPPSAPNMVSGTQIRSSKNVKLVWRTSTDNISVAKYTIHYKKDSIGATQRTISFTPTSATNPNTSYEIPASVFGGDGNGAYNIYVSATDNDSITTVGAGLASLFIYDTTPPQAPSKPEILTRTNTKTILTWTDGGDNIGTTEYLIFVNGVKKDTIQALSLPYTLTNPVPMPDSIQITIKARDAKFNTSSLSQKGVVKKIPAININEATGFVGIGIVPPTDRLHVAGNLKIEDGSIIFKGTPPLGTHLKTEDNIDIKIGNNLNFNASDVNNPNRITYNGTAFEFFSPTQAQFNGNKPVLSLGKYGDIQFNSSPILNYNPLLLKNDNNNGIKYGEDYGGATNFKGPIVFGENGGALGSAPTNHWDDPNRKTALKWDALGRVGIGVAGALTDKLEVNGTVKTGSIKLVENTPTISFIPNSPGASSWYHIRQNRVGDGELEFSTGEAPGTNVKMKLQSDGKLGIGVAGTLTDRLHVGGNMRLTNANRATYSVYDNDGGNLGYSVRTNAGGGWAWQMVDGGNNAYFHVNYPTGNVGIGTTNPAEKLEVNGNTKITGNLGIGTSPKNDINVLVNHNLYLMDQNKEIGGLSADLINGESKFTIFGTNRLANGNLQGGAAIELFPQTNAFMNRNGSINLWSNAAENSSAEACINFGSAVRDANGTIQYPTHMNISKTGLITMGLNAPTNCKLGVEGNVRVKGIIAAYELVANASATPDFVFEKSYTLPSLEETKQYVQTHKHLPYIKSAKELESTGINMTEHTNGMLRHIEEMYLHIIKLEEEIKDLKAKK